MRGCIIRLGADTRCSVQSINGHTMSHTVTSVSTADATLDGLASSAAATLLPIATEHTKTGNAFRAAITMAAPLHR